MKQTTTLVRSLFVAIALFFTSVMAFAQDKAVEINTTTTSTTSSNTPVIQPWMYVLGAAVFILLLVALMRGNKNKG